MLCETWVKCNATELFESRLQIQERVLKFCSLEVWWFYICLTSNDAPDVERFARMGVINGHHLMYEISLSAMSTRVIACQN